jgi:hypothetical protein
MIGKNRIMIYGPKRDGTYVVEFRTADGDALAISVPAGDTRVLWATYVSRDGRMGHSQSSPPSQ